MIKAFVKETLKTAYYILCGMIGALLTLVVIGTTDKFFNR